MARVTGFTAERMKAIEDSCVVSGAVVLDALILTQRDGTEINAGVMLRGPKGDQGPQGIQGDQGPQGIQGAAGVGPTGTVVMFAGSTAPSGHLLCDGSAVSRTTYSDLFDAIGTKYGAGNGSTTFNLPNLKGRLPVGLDANQTEFAALGQTGGAKTHLLTAAEMPSHTHIQNSHTHTINNASVAAASHSHSLSAAGYAAIMIAANTNQTVVMRRITTGSWQSTVAVPTNAALAYSAANAVGAELGGSTDLNTSSTTVSAASTTPTNQNAGGGGSHNNLQPYVVMNYIIKT